MKVGGLFSGIGGFELGLVRAGFEIAWMVEKDEFCQKILKKHAPEYWPIAGIHDDVCTFSVDTSANLLYNQLPNDKKEVIDMSAKRKDYDEAVKLYNSGLSIDDVAEFYGISRQAMWMILKRRGCEFRPNVKYGSDNHFFRGTSDDDRAQNIVEKAIKKGVLVRQPCQTCGANGKMSDGRSEVQAHHPDYNKPLDVMWLCQKCHHEWHKHYKSIQRKEVMPDGEATKLATVELICGGFP